MITPAILFNRRPAFNALLGIGMDPIRRLGIIRALLEPFLGQRADARLVIIQSTPTVVIVLSQSN